MEQVQGGGFRLEKAISFLGAVFRSLTLSLLVLGDLADHAHGAIAMDHLALVADLLDGCANLHETPQLLALRF